jgi:hypothetical protein
MSQVTLNRTIKDEIARLSEKDGIDPHLLEEFASFVIANYSKEKPKTQSKPLTIHQLKKAIYELFNVESTDQLKRSNAFQMATDGMGKLNYSYKETWKKLYRKLIGVLPHEAEEEGYGCINGIDIFKYFQPWQVFDLDPKTATKEDIKQAYYKLSKIYHPDVSGSGDDKIFERINTMYKSLVAEG